MRTRYQTPRQSTAMWRLKKIDKSITNSTFGLKKRDGILSYLYFDPKFKSKIMRTCGAWLEWCLSPRQEYASCWARARTASCRRALWSAVRRRTEQSNIMIIIPIKIKNWFIKNKKINDKFQKSKPAKFRSYRSFCGTAVLRAWYWPRAPPASCWLSAWKRQARNNCCWSLWAYVVANTRTLPTSPRSVKMLQHLFENIKILKKF